MPEVRTVKEIFYSVEDIGELVRKDYLANGGDKTMFFNMALITGPRNGVLITCPASQITTEKEDRDENQTDC